MRRAAAGSVRAGPGVAGIPPRREARNCARGILGRTALALLIVAAAISHSHAAPACDQLADFERLASAEAEIAYRWEPASLKVGQFFAAEVIVCRPSEAVRAIVLDARMPQHGHGMNYRPAVAETAPGRFRVTGLMLHMPGKWRLTFDLFQGDKRTRLSRDVMLKP